MIGYFVLCKTKVLKRVVPWNDLGQLQIKNSPKILV